MKIEFILNKIDSLFYYLFKFPWYYVTLKELGLHTRIKKPIKIEGYQNISIGNG